MTTLIWNAAQVGLTVIGIFFFVSALLALYRFPDTMSKLHALTKADNLGLGFIIAGAMVRHMDQPFLVLKLALVYLTLIFAGSVSGYLIAHQIYEDLQEEEASS